MKRFSKLYAEIDATNKTNEKVAAMAEYFGVAPPEDAAWAVHFLVGRRPKRILTAKELSTWAFERAAIPDWLFAECYDAVGDLAETIALILPSPMHASDDLPLHRWVQDLLLPLPSKSEEHRRESMLWAWDRMDANERLVLNKLITGAFRVGVSQDLVVRALAQVSGHSPAVVAQSLMGDWSPSADFFLSLMSSDATQVVGGRPYPFCLAHPIDGGVEALGPVADWSAEWKWDGIRAQAIRRAGQSFVWSRGEELIVDRFPEIRELCDNLPDGTVLDGEILAWSSGRPLGFAELQKRIGRKTVTKRILHEVPVVLVAFDLLEREGSDLRETPFAERRQMLEHVVAPLEGLPVVLSPQVSASSWEELAQKRQESRAMGVEGLMLKRIDSPYAVGRKKGLWWKWKVTPLTVDAVLIYAQPGNGKRASLFTDYTFGLWSEGKLVPFAKAYSGLDDEEIRLVDAFVRRSTLERFGPVRTVKPELVMELAFEGIQLSGRHRSGIAVRFPRIQRWRHDKRPEDADSIDTVKEMLRLLSSESRGPGRNG